MDTENKDKILSKLRKLMDLQKSAKALGNEGEANAAAAGISRLLMLYNLSENDIPSEEKVNNPIEIAKIPYLCKGHRGQWYTNLVNTVCENNLCRVLLSGKQVGRRKQWDSLDIIGRRKNIEIVLYLIDYLSAQFQMIGRRYYNKVYIEHNYKCLSISRFMTAFLYGCVNGLVAQYESLKQEMKIQYEGTTALVLSSQQEISEFIQNQQWKVGTHEARSASISDFSAYYAGRKTGENINLQSGLSGKSNSEQQKLIE